MVGIAVGMLDGVVVGTTEGEIKHTVCPIEG